MTSRPMFWPRFDGRRALAWSAGLVVVLTMAAKVAAAGKEVLVAALFGVSASLDAFLVAFAISTFFVSMIGGAVNVALQPAVSRVAREASAATVAGLVSRFIAIAAGAGFLVSAAAAALAPALLSALGTKSPELSALTRSLLLVLLPATLLQCTSLAIAAPLNMAGKAALVQTGGLISALTIAALLWLGGAVWGVTGLAVAHVVGLAAEAGFLLVLGRAWWSVAREDLRAARVYVHSVLAQVWPIAAGAFLTSSASLIDALLAGTLAAGSVSGLTYAARIVSVLLTIGHTLIHTMAFPAMAQRATAGDYAGLRNLARRVGLWVLGLSVPVVLVVAAATPTVVRLLFQRGEFSAADTVAVSTLQVVQLMQVPFNLAAFASARLLSAMEQTRPVLVVAGVTLVVKTVSTVVLMHIFGAAGIAAATVIAFATSAGLQAWVTVRLLRQGADHA